MLFWLFLIVAGFYTLISAAMDRDALMKGPTASILIILYGRKFVRFTYYILGLFLLFLSLLPIIDLLIFGFPHI